MHKTLLCLGLLSSVLYAEPRKIGEFKVKNPAFLTVADSQNAGEKELLVSSFGIMGGDALLRIPLSKQSLSEIDSWVSLTVSSDLTWPNQVSRVPEEVFGENKFSVGTGFLVPGRSTGAVEVLDLYSGKKQTLSKKKSGYFYHKVVWHDMNADGRLDAISARGKKPVFGATDGELVWFEQPETLDAQWTEHLIAKGPDVNFQIVDLDSNGEIEIIATEFFAKKLSLHWMQDGQWKSRTLDESLGAAFDLEYVDLNNDGERDLLVTNHEGNSKASIYAYELPADPFTGEWIRHTLLTGIKTEKGGLNQASPGSAFAVHPNLEKTADKPWILAGGDGSTKLHLLTANSEDTNDWSYTETILLDTSSTIGTIAFDDIDGDNSIEVFVPAYDDSLVHVFKLDGN